MPVGLAGTPDRMDGGKGDARRRTRRASDGSEGAEWLALGRSALEEAKAKERERRISRHPTPTLHAF